MKENKKGSGGTLLGCGLLFTLFSIFWVYLFSQTGIGFTDTLNPGFIFELLKAETVLFLILIAFVLAVSIFILVYFSRYLEKEIMAGIVVGGSILTIIAGTFWFTNIMVFSFIMVFYMIGCLFLVRTVPEIEETKFSKIKIGWKSSRKILFSMGLGGFLAGLIFVYVDLTEYQQNVKDSLLNATQMNLAGVITRDDVENIVIQQELTRDEIRSLIQDQFSGLSWFNDLLPSQQTMLVEEATDQTYNYQIENRDSNVDRLYNIMISKLESGEPLMGTEILDRIPIMKTMLNLLPVFSGLIIMSGILFFSQILVSPFSALLALLLKK